MVRQKDVQRMLLQLTNMAAMLRCYTSTRLALKILVYFLETFLCTRIRGYEKITIQRQRQSSVKCLSMPLRRRFGKKTSTPRRLVSLGYAASVTHAGKRYVISYEDSVPKVPMLTMNTFLRTCRLTATTSSV